jgi:RNA polymerase sigma-70 factor (ECF subfamily)
VGKTTPGAVGYDGAVHRRETTSAPRRGFATTQWSVVLAARAGDPVRAQEALAALCATYWPPLYAYARRLGRSAADAEDVTQGFFLSLLEREALQQVDRAKGRFRSFLIAAFRHFLANERDRAQAQKRGGHHALVSIDAALIESRYAASLADTRTAEELYDRMWAITLLEHVMQRLEEEQVHANKRAFDHLKVYLTGDASTGYAEVALATGMSVGAVKVAVHRLRRRYRELLWDEAARTVDAPEAIKDEVRELMAALTR